jgi:hypothetical protein
MFVFKISLVVDNIQGVSKKQHTLPSENTFTCTFYVHANAMYMEVNN